MYTVLFISGTSAVISLLLVLLFGIERRRGSRFFPRFRTLLDRGVEALYRMAGRLSRLLGRDVIRHTLHYLFHRFLRAFRTLLRRLEARTDSLLRANREIAKRTRGRADTDGTDDAPRSSLDEVVAHKADTALSPREKRLRKEKSVGTKL